MTINTETKLTKKISRNFYSLSLFLIALLTIFYFSFCAYDNFLSDKKIESDLSISNQKIIETARKLGITSKIAKDDATIILGTSEVTLLEMAIANAIIANGGIKISPYYIEKIEDKNRKILFESANNKAKEEMEAILSLDAVSQIKEAMALLS